MVAHIKLETYLTLSGMTFRSCPRVLRAGLRLIWPPSSPARQPWPPLAVPRRNPSPSSPSALSSCSCPHRLPRHRRHHRRPRRPAPHHRRPHRPAKATPTSVTRPNSPSSRSTTRPFSTSSNNERPHPHPVRAPQTWLSPFPSSFLALPSFHSPSTRSCWSPCLRSPRPRSLQQILLVCFDH